MTGRFVRSARHYSLRRSSGKDFAERPDDRCLGNANQSIGWSPLLQESVPIASPTCVALASQLFHVLDISNNNIRAWHKIWHSGTDCMLHGRHDH